MIERVRTADSTFNATTLANLSEIYRELGQFDQALPLAKRALDILEKSGSDESKRATVMNNLGLIFKSQGNYAEALRNFQQSLTLTENRLDKTHPDVAGTLSNLSALYLELNDTSTALSLAQRSLAICEQAYGSNHTTTATVINSIAVVYARLGDNKKSLELYQRSLAILVATVGEDHPRTAQVQANIAALYKGDGKLEEALAMYQKALTTYVNSLGTEHPDLISVLDNMADVYYQQHDYKNAIKVIDWAYRIGAQTASPIHWKAPLYLASLEALMGERDAAIYFGKQGINALQELRTSVAKIGTEEQKSFLSDKSWRYVGLADLLIQEGRIPEAQQVMAMLKEEEYFDFIRRDAGGDGKQLSLAELRTGGWKFDGVDMMTLSACNTAVDGAGNGREFEGFGALVQRQGAKGVLATLWPVADQSTAILMQPFYRSRQEKHLTKAEALREAQLALINGTHKLPKGLKALPAVKNAGAPNAPVFTPDPAKPYAHPYYWAPFILMGNWL